MQAIMRNGTVKEIDTSFMFNDQYITVDGERIYDVNIKQIVDDIRLGEFYCCSKKQGTYEEVAQAIVKEREKINQCEDCFWYQINNRVEDLCHKERIKKDNRLTINETVVYELCCKYKKEYGEKCVYDIDEEPKLFREMADCYFCKHPEGAPDNKDFVRFLIDNAEKYEIVPYWACDELNINNSFKYAHRFGSYMFEKSYFGSCFKLSNARNSFKFYVDTKNKSFVLDTGIGYKEVKRFEVSQWQNGKSINVAITNWDKFAKWIFQIMDDYEKENEKMKIEFKTGNAAFDDYSTEEIKRILMEIINKIDMEYDSGSVMDINGNKIGEWRL